MSPSSVCKKCLNSRPSAYQEIFWGCSILSYFSKLRSIQLVLFFPLCSWLDGDNSSYIGITVVEILTYKFTMHVEYVC